MLVLVVVVMANMRREADHNMIDHGLMVLASTCVCVCVCVCACMPVKQPNICECKHYLIINQMDGNCSAPICLVSVVSISSPPTKVTHFVLVAKTFQVIC